MYFFGNSYGVFANIMETSFETDPSFSFKITDLFNETSSWSHCIEKLQFIQITCKESKFTGSFANVFSGNAKCFEPKTTAA